jgi:CheY-like chemotaxis protein
VALTSQLLAFSQRSHVEAKPVDIDAVVRGLERMLRRLIGEDIELVVRVGAELATVAGDAGQIEQLVVNFAVNARDAMPAGGRLDIATDVVTVAADDPRGIAAGSYVRVAVSDTGAGMDEATRRRAFEPFFTTKEPGRGTGLGLWTCYGIVRAMAGDIALASAPGTGTTVTVLLPTTEEVATAPGGVAVRGGDETILLVEDDPAVRGVTARILRDRGYTVLVAARGSDALAIALEHAAAIDAIVSDVVMPGASGPDVVASLRGVVPDARVLLMSGHVDHPSLRGIADAADTTFLAKPFSPARLAAAVRDLLDRGPTYNPAVKS